MLLFALVWASVASACATSGISGIYMANDAGGIQHRDVFYSDSNSVYCIAKFSAGNPDTTLDWTISQTGVYPWCGDTAKLDTNPDDLHSIFAVGETVPGVGVESIVAYDIEPEGIQIDFMCTGYCTVNSAGPNGNLCNGPPEYAGACSPGYSPLGPNTCGPGATCCFSDVPGSSQMGSGAQQLPFPVGTYTCTLQIDGNVVGSTDFTIIYPPTNCPVPPPITGVPCYQWFPEGSSCMGDVPNTMCRCIEAGIWSCVDK